MEKKCFSFIRSGSLYNPCLAGRKGYGGKLTGFWCTFILLVLCVMVANSASLFAETTPQISGGYYHSLSLKSDGTVWAWGGNDYGQLGDGTTEDGHTPVQANGLNLGDTTTTPTPIATSTLLPTPTPTPTETIQAIVDIQDKTINLNSTRTFFAKIRLPSGYDIDDIRCESIECEGAQASKCQKDEKEKKKLKVYFNIQYLADLDVSANETKTIELTITGELTDGTPFKGSDMAKVREKNDVPDGTGRIYGKVVYNNRPLEGATVTIENKSFKEERTTDVFGDFSFENLAWDHYTFTTEKAGYKKPVRLIRLSEKVEEVYIFVRLQKKK